MREWLRGGAPPCQGGGRGFESRLALFCFIVSFYWLGLDFIRVPGFFAYNLTWERQQMRKRNLIMLEEAQERLSKIKMKEETETVWVTEALGRV